MKTFPIPFNVGDKLVEKYGVAQWDVLAVLPSECDGEWRYLVAGHRGVMHMDHSRLEPRDSTAPRGRKGGGDDKES